MLFGVLLISRGFTPYLNTSGRLIASGFGIASVLLLLPLLMTTKPIIRHSNNRTGQEGSCIQIRVQIMEGV